MLFGLLSFQKTRIQNAPALLQPSHKFNFFILQDSFYISIFLYL